MKPKQRGKKGSVIIPGWGKTEPRKPETPESLKDEETVSQEIHAHIRKPSGTSPKAGKPATYAFPFLQMIA